jgi:ABC-type multidrug transport system ATPase subunit
MPECVHHSIYVALLVGVGTVLTYCYTLKMCVWLYLSLQDNVHVAALTVRETLEFAARLRISGRMSRADRAKRVEGLLAVMGLTSVQHSLVGDEAHRGISGGELKRLSIAVEVRCVISYAQLLLW